MKRVREGENMESFAAVVPFDELLSGTDVDMPRHVVDVLSTTGEPASCWFHHEKATPSAPQPGNPSVWVGTMNTSERWDINRHTVLSFDQAV